MKQKILSVVLGLVVALVAAGCGGKYSDVVEVNQSYAKLMKAYVDDVAGVDNAAKAAKAISNLADGMEKLVPKMKAVRKKYPELEKQKDLPEKIKKSEQEIIDAGKDFGSSFMKLMPYMGDKKVQAAQARLTGIMSSMGQE